MGKFKLIKIISGLLIVASVSVSVLNPIEIYAAETEGNSVQSTDTIVNNVGSELKVNSEKESDKSLNNKDTVSVTGVMLNESSAVINQGDTLKLKETVLPSNADNKKVTWKSSNTDVARVSSNGEVKGISEGTTTITCTANDGSGRSDTCKVTVYYSYYNKIGLLNKDGSAMELYSDDKYNSNNIVSEAKNKRTYYAKASSDNISVNIKRLDEKYIKVFRVTSYSDIGEVRRAKLVDNDNIVLDPGTTTLIIRVYNNKPDSSIKYEDDNNILNEYEVKVELDK